jgi:hypothetical protein
MKPPASNIIKTVETKWNDVQTLPKIKYTGPNTKAMETTLHCVIVSWKYRAAEFIVDTCQNFYQIVKVMIWEARKCLC